MWSRQGLVAEQVALAWIGDAVDARIGEEVQTPLAIFPEREDGLQTGGGRSSHNIARERGRRRASVADGSGGVVTGACWSLRGRPQCAVQVRIQVPAGASHSAQLWHEFESRP